MTGDVAKGAGGIRGNPNQDALSEHASGLLGADTASARPESRVGRSSRSKAATDVTDKLDINKAYWIMAHDAESTVSRSAAASKHIIKEYGPYGPLVFNGPGKVTHRR